MLRKKDTGFTIVELIVVIVMIGVLAAATLVAYNAIQQQGRDTRRVADLQAISDAISTYRIKAGNDIQAGSGCGSNGNGWFNYADGGSYPATTLSCLTDAGYLDDNYKDPSGCLTSLAGCSGKGAGYMKYTCGAGDAAKTYLYAHMETTDDTAKLDSSNVCSSRGVIVYGMNYMLVVD